MSLLGLFLLVSQAAGYGPEALQDEITSLPGIPSGSWKLFSGYVDVSAPEEPKGTRQMFYWFVESQAAPASDPVILWTNGGPGCSGLGGFLSEQGPFRVMPGGSQLEKNPYSWTRLANMVFIEQPVGVGFSTATTKLQYGDAQAAADNHRFVLGFFERFAQYKSNDFYISSESYGGHYMPTLAQKLKEGREVPQFKGVFLGNPLTYMMYRNYGQYGTYWGHQLLPAPLWHRYEAASCATTFPPSTECSKTTDEMDKILNVLDPYALDFPKCNEAEAAGREERWMLRRTIQTANGQEALTEPYQPCAEELFKTYLNRPDVQTAIHVKTNITWGMCSETVGSGYNTTDVNAPMMDVWKWLITQGDLKIMIYSGDDDSICATLGSQQFVWDLGYAAKAGASWEAWKVDGQLAGFKTDFEVPTGSFSFVTVHGAGHMVPATQPERSLELLASFLGSQPTEIVV